MRESELTASKILHLSNSCTLQICISPSFHPLLRSRGHFRPEEVLDLVAVPQQPLLVQEDVLDALFNYRIHLIF